MKGPFSTGRLVCGIISIVLTFLVLFQSCAAGVANTLEANGEVSGSAGFLLAICLLVAGIVGIVTRNSSKKAGPFTCAGFYLIGALIAACNVGTYSDLAIWAGVSAIFGALFLVAGIKTKAE
ncbi:MAG: hypothetical protein ACI4HI_17245 [Lachnospiraceae bacterium]